MYIHVISACHAVTHSAYTLSACNLLTTNHIESCIHDGYTVYNVHASKQIYSQYQRMCVVFTLSLCDTRPPRSTSCGEC